MWHHAPYKPNQESQNAAYQNKHHPEPEEDINLLIEEIQGQSTLYGISMYIAQASHFEVAHGHPREDDPWRVMPVVVSPGAFQDVQPIVMKSGAEDVVQEKELEEDVGDVQDLGHHVQDDQIAAHSGKERWRSQTLKGIKEVWIVILGSGI